MKSNSFLGKKKACSVSDYYTLFAERQVRLKSRVGRNWKLNFFDGPFISKCKCDKYIVGNSKSVLSKIIQCCWLSLHFSLPFIRNFIYNPNYLPLRIESLSPSYNLLLFILVCDIDLGLGHFSSFTNFFKSMGCFCTSIEWK